MRAGLLLPLVMLAGVAVVTVFTMIAARQRRQLATRVEKVVPPVAAPRPQVNPNLRLRPGRDRRLTSMAKLLQIPLDLPLANVVAPVWIFLVATALALTAAWGGHLLLGWVVGGIEGAVVWIVVVRGTFGWELGRYRARLVKQLPDAIQLVISATRAGLPVSEAFRAIAEEMPSPTREEFVRVDNEMAMGIQADEALLDLHRRTGVTEYAIFAVTIGVQSRSGGRLAETIQNLADTVRERLTIAGRARALAGEAKISAIIMALLPVISGIMLSFIRPGHLDPLFNDPRGIRMFLVGVTTLVLGAATMRQMIRGATRD